MRVFDEQDQKYVAAVFKDFKAGWLEVDEISLPSHPKSRVILFGLGDKKKWTHRKLYLAARKITQYCKGSKKKNFSILLDDFKVDRATLEQCAEWFCRESELAHYEINLYREIPKNGWPAV